MYNRQSDGSLNFIESIEAATGVDNIEFGPSGKLWIGCHPSLLHFSSYAAGKKEIAPSEIITIDYRSEGDYDVESIYVEDGTEMSAATVAVPYEDLIFFGNVMDDQFLILKTNK